MSHTAEIIAVGTELLLGNIANTNAQELSEALAGLGINVFWHTVVGDNPRRLKEALDIARKRADVIITTGGLGPTYDDLTKQTICEVFGRPLVLHPELEEAIREMFFSGEVTFNDEVYITNLRQKECLMKALNSLELVHQSIEDYVPEDFYTVDLLNAYESLGLIIGEAVTDDLVDKIFHEFCMGK